MRTVKLNILIAILVCSCNQKSVDDQKQEILSLKQMNDLATVEYIVNKIIKANDNQTWYKVGDRKILMSCKATLRAGIDFSRIETTDISIKGKEIDLKLPHATLFYVNMKPEDISIAYQDIGMFRSEFSSQERDDLAKQAQIQIQNSADSLGILQTAEANASLFVSNFLQRLGYEKISISFSGNPTPSKLN